MATVVKGSTVKKNLKFFIYGRQGTWKSSLALQLAAMTREDGKPIRLLYIDAEYGSVDNYLEDFCDEYGVNPDNILLVKANTYNDIEDYINKAILNEEIYIEDEDGNEEVALDSEGKPFIADAIVLDSATVIQDTTKYGMIKTSEKRAGLKAESRDATSTEKFVAVETAGMEFKDYDKLNQKGKNLLRSLVTRTDKYVCVISREKDETKKIKNSKGEFENVVVGHKPDCFKDAEYEFYTVLRMYEDENTGNVVAKVDRKDRTKLYERNSIIENPTLLAWQEVIDKNIGKKSAALDSRSYDEIVEEQANQLQKPKNTKKQEEQVVEVDNNNNVEVSGEFDSSELFTQITDIRKRLKPQERSGLTVQLSKNGLPTPSKSLPVETLLKIKEVCEEYEDGLQK